MIVDHVDQRTVRSALELAARAPSVHNSQPWRWLLGPKITIRDRVLDGTLLRQLVLRVGWAPLGPPLPRRLAAPSTRRSSACPAERALLTPP